MNKAMEAALEQCLEHLYAPSANCSCHISPPCNDCVDYAGIRDAIRDAKAALSQQPAQPIDKSAHDENEWANAQAICDLPLVDEAIRALLLDQTGDNATMIVREVLRAMSAQQSNYAPKSFGTIGHTAIRPSGSKITTARNKAKKQRRKSK
jgi:hypothetical protein